MARIRPRRQKGLTLVDAAILLVILGLLAVGTIPVFVRSVRRTRMAEATMNLRKIFDTSVTYFVAHPDGPDDPLHVRQFPDTVAPTPDDWWATVCGDGSARPYPPRPDTWSAPTWKAIGFAIETPFYYEYTYLSRGRGDDASFTARAMGDLDCDGVRSTFERSSPDGTGDGPFPLYSAKPFE